MTRSVRYYNLPALREASLSRAYWAVLRQQAKRKAPEIMLSYNVRPHTVALARRAKRAWGTLWIPIIADVAAERGEHMQLQKWLRKSDAVVALSWWYFESCPVKHKLHMDGGVECIRVTNDAVASDGPRDVLFAGNLGRFTGVQVLIEAFQLLSDPNLRLVICGKGDSEPIRAAGLRDSRIVFKGFVPELELDALCHRAAVLVNPRPPGIADNAYNFPSKLIECLSYTKPVVSTWTPGLAPEYSALLTVAAGEGPRPLADALEKALNCTQEQLSVRREQARKFIEGSRTWEKQANRLSAFLSDLLDKHR